MDFLDMRFLSFIGIKKTPDAPWKKYYKKNDMKINIHNENIYQFLKNRMIKNNYENNIAINYYNFKITYKEFFEKIDLCAEKFKMLGVKKYDIVTIISANIPEALISFYALNKIGAVTNLLHPMLSENEIKESLKLYKTKYLLALDITIPKVNSTDNLR